MPGGTFSQPRATRASIAVVLRVLTATMSIVSVLLTIAFVSSPSADAAVARVERTKLVSDIACPSASQCTAIDSQGREVTFDPKSPHAKTPTTIGPPSVVSDENTFAYTITCPSVSACVAVDGSIEVVFDPSTPQTHAQTDLLASNPYVVREDLTGGTDEGPTLMEDLSCPTASQCTAVGSFSGEATFDPALVSASSPVKVDESLVEVPATTQGKPVLVNGQQLILSLNFTSVSCPSVSECIGVTSADMNGEGLISEVTFDPASGGVRPLVALKGSGEDGAAIGTQLACPAVTQCTSIAEQGSETTFSPSSPTTAVSARIAAPHLTEVVCPSTSQCTAIDEGSATVSEITFNPAAPGSPHRATFDLGTISGLACPTVSQCTVVDRGGLEQTFNPRSPTALKHTKTAPRRVAQG